MYAPLFTDYVSTTKFHICLSCLPQVLPPDKSKKSWSQRFKINKTEKQQLLVYNEPEITVPSALSRSMKYAEPWLYGTIRGIPAPPANRQQMFAQMPDVAVVVCSCPEYLNGTKRDPKKATICKKCRGSRLPLATMGGTLRLHSTAPIVHASRGSAGTVRLPSAYNAKQRPSILNAEHDPYDMMRRSRLMSPELQPTTNAYKTRNRAKSSSPSRSRGRSRRRTPSPSSTVIPTGLRSRSASRSNQHVESQWLTETEQYMSCVDGNLRRSILQSEFNAYELISNISHNNEFSPSSLADDYVYHMHSQKYENILNPNFNMAELAGQRIKLSNDRNSSVQQELEHYEDIFNGDESAEQMDGDQPMLPERPPRRKPDEQQTTVADDESERIVSVAGSAAETSPNDFVLTTASLSHISSDMRTNLQINVIKSILKRPPSIGSILTTETDVHTIKSMAYTNQKLLKHTSGGGGGGGGSSSILLAKNAIAINNGNHHNHYQQTTNVQQQRRQSAKEKRNSGSHFYLPMPQRKKVQFLDENEIIKDVDRSGCVNATEEPSTESVTTVDNNVKLSLISTMAGGNSTNSSSAQKLQPQQHHHHHHEGINHDDGNYNSKDQSSTITGLSSSMVTIGIGNSSTTIANHNNLDQFTDSNTTNGVVIIDGDGNNVNGGGGSRLEYVAENIVGDNVADRKAFRNIGLDETVEGEFFFLCFSIFFVYTNRYTVYMQYNYTIYKY